MENKEFFSLKDQLEGLMDEVDRLQKIYHKETGKYFVREIRLTENKKWPITKQLNFLIGELESIRDDYSPWHGEDAINMMNAAHDALVELEQNT